MIIALGTLSDSALRIIGTVLLDMHEYKLCRLLHDRVVDEMIRRGNGRAGYDDGSPMTLAPIIGNDDAKVSAIARALRAQTIELANAARDADSSAKAATLLEASKFFCDVAESVCKVALTT